MPINLTVWFYRLYST